MNAKPSTHQTVSLLLFSCTFMIAAAVVMVFPAAVMNETKSFRQIFHQLVVTLCVTCRNIFEYTLKLNRKKESNRNWNVLTQPHLFLHFQMNVQIHIERERRSLTTILFFNDTLNVTKNMSCKSKTADEFMSKNRHQILVHEYPYSHSIIPVKASPNHKACQVWMKYAKWNYCGWVLSYWEIQHRESPRTSRSKREIRIRNVITCIFTLDLLLHHGEMSAYKKPIYFSLQANGKLFAKM